MEKLDLTTPNFINGNIVKLVKLFPNCVAEKKISKGEIERGIDFDALRQELSGKQPLRVVFRDDGFSSDTVRINIEQIFKLKSPATDIKVI